MKRPAPKKKRATKPAKPMKKPPAMMGGRARQTMARGMGSMPMMMGMPAGAGALDRLMRG